MKTKLYKNNACTFFERLSSGLWAVTLRAPSGELADKVRCDDYRMALDYWRAFNAQARTMGAA